MRTNEPSIGNNAFYSDSAEDTGILSLNAALKHGYGFLEGECRMGIKAVGLEPSVGFLHDFSYYQTKQSLVYDLQEPFRWIIDYSVVRSFEPGALNLHDFYFTGDDYRHKFEAEGKQRFIGVSRENFNAGVRYKGRVLKWDTVIEQKTNELGRFLTGKIPRVNFEEPAPRLDRQDNRELRAKMLTLTSARARLLEIGKSTLHSLTMKARRPKPFRVYKSVEQKLMEY